jgi:acetyl-CoA carboxylase carboxyltransferase component
MGAKGAVEVLEGRKIREIKDPDEATAYAAKKEEEYRDKFANPYEAARYGYIDDVIEPRNTRFRIIRALQVLANKKESLPPKKHSNIPL